MKKPYEERRDDIPSLFIHPKEQIDGRIQLLERLIQCRSDEISSLQRDLKNYQDEHSIWIEILNIIRTYEVTDEVRERLIRTQTLRIDPPID